LIIVTDGLDQHQKDDACVIFLMLIWSFFRRAEKQLG